MEPNNEETEKEKKETNDPNQQNDEQQEQQSGETGGRKRKGFFKGLMKNIKGAIKKNPKDILMLKIKLVVIAVVAIVLITMIIIEGLLTEEASSSTTASVGSVYSSYSSGISSNNGNGGSSSNEITEAEKAWVFDYEKTGSLVLATEKQLGEIAQAFYDSIKNDNKQYEAFNIKYSGNTSNTVANKINNIKSSEGIIGIPEVTGTVKTATGETSLSQERTIYEHILRAEKYNFNNIIWRSFEKSGSGLKQTEINFTVDNDTKLKYPVKDTNESDASIHDLSFYVSKVKPYLQSYYIPLDLMLGTRGSASADSDVINTKFAYEILASAYHQIVLDRYKVESLTRKTSYTIYDNKTATIITTRTCADYDLGGTREVVLEKGQNCTKDDYNAGRCTDSVMSVTVKCTRRDYNEGNHGCSDVGDKKKTEYTQNCKDKWVSGCSYGTIKEDTTITVSNVQTICTDKVEESIATNQSNIKESLSTAESKQYRWDYVVSTAKTFDVVITNEYELKGYTNYTKDNYNSFINDSGEYEDMTVEQFRESELSNSGSDVYTYVEEDYYNRFTKESVGDTSWNEQFVVDKIPDGAVKKTDYTSQVVLSQIDIIKEGKKYNDTYVWSDKLTFKETKTGTYNLESLIDVTGDILQSKETSYYGGSDLNLVEIMNASEEKYSNYISSGYSKNMGIYVPSLDIGFDILKTDIQESLGSHSLVSLSYGTSIGVDIDSFKTLSGLSFSGVGNITAGDMEGMKVSYPIANEDLADSWLWLTLADKRSYGYIGHMGVDITYSQSAEKTDKALCGDVSVSQCAYVRGPAVYSMFDGTIEEVVYSAWNNKHSKGNYLGKTKDGDLVINDNTGYGSYIVIKNVDGSYTLYGHLFPDKDYFTQLSKNIGKSVTAGTFLAYMGNTGSSEALHLHLEFSRSMSSIGSVSNSLYTGEYVKKVVAALGITPVYH